MTLALQSESRFVIKHLSLLPLAKRNTWKFYTELTSPLVSIIKKNKFTNIRPKQNLNYKNVA